MLQPEWLLDSVDKKTMLSEYEYDYQKLQETARAHSKKAIDLGESNPNIHGSKAPLLHTSSADL